MAQYERIGYGSPDGSQWGGSAGEPIAFYGSTPLVRQGIGQNVSTASHASTVVSSLVVALKTIGLFQTSTYPDTTP